MAGEIEATARGHLAADAAVKLVGTREVTELRLAVGVRRKDAADVWQDVRTDWLDVSVWNRLGVDAATLTKGQLVEVTGLLVPGAYLTKTGEAVASSKLVASKVLVVPRAPRADQTAPDGAVTPF